MRSTGSCRSELARDGDRPSATSPRPTRRGGYTDPVLAAREPRSRRPRRPPLLEEGASFVP
jgi:hypothetical protein